MSSFVRDNHICYVLYTSIPNHWTVYRHIQIMQNIEDLSNHVLLIQLTFHTNDQYSSLPQSCSSKLSRLLWWKKSIANHQCVASHYVISHPTWALLMACLNEIFKWFETTTACHGKTSGITGTRHLYEIMLFFISTRVKYDLVFIERLHWYFMFVDSNCLSFYVKYEYVVSNRTINLVAWGR